MIFNRFKSSKQHGDAWLKKSSETSGIYQPEIAKHNGTHITSIDINLSTKRSYSVEIAWKSLLGNMLFEGEVNEVWNEV